MLAWKVNWPRFGVVLFVAFIWFLAISVVCWLCGVDLVANLGLFVQGGADAVHWLTNLVNPFEPQMAIPPYRESWMYNAGQLSTVGVLLLLTFISMLVRHWHIRHSS